MASNKKLATSVAAVAAAAVVLVGGTFAWQSISQTALNESSDVVNPGGRLHDDFYIDANGDYNADIYVENFADDEIFARVRLQEYMEVVINYGVEGAERVETIAGSKSLNGTVATDTDAGAPSDNTSGYTYEYETHYFDQTNATDDFWTWTMGSADSAEVYYMPTFNMNKDSLVADRNGMYADRIGGISNRGQEQYQDADGNPTWTIWKNGNTKTADEIWDVDSNSLDEVGYDFENLNTYEDAGNIAMNNATHEATAVGTTNGIISMDRWLALYNAGDETDDYWVYDTDGWIYWSSPIKSGETTGLLLDAIELDNIMDDTWYYAIEATGQFVTLDDIGYSDGTGFWTDNDLDGEADSPPSINARKLLRALGADVPISYVLSSTTDISGLEKVDVTIDGVTLTYVRVSDAISVEELQSSYYLKVTTYEENETDTQLAVLREVEFDQTNEYAAVNIMMFVVYTPCTIQNSEFSVSGIYLPCFSEDLLTEAGLTNMEMELGMYEPEDVRMSFDAGGDVTAELLWNGTLVISGDGAMTDYGADSDVPWDSYSKTITAVEIGEGVTSVGAYAFDGLSALESVSLSRDVTTIGYQAFHGCNSLKAITFQNEELTSIGANAFWGCDALETVTFEGNNVTLGAQAFWGCNALKTVTFKGDNVTLGENAFWGCDALETVTFKGDNVTIGQYAFRSCTSLKTIAFEGDYVTLGYYAIWGCDALETLTFKSNNVTLGSAIVYCTTLKTVTFEGDNVTIGEAAFRNCGALESVIFEGTVVSFSSSAFYSCSGYTIYFAGTEEEWNALGSGYEAVCNYTQTTE